MSRNIAEDLTAGSGKTAVRDAGPVKFTPAPEDETSGTL
jgi:hypothetical protein